MTKEQNATPGATHCPEDSVRLTVESSRPRELLTSNERFKLAEQRALSWEPMAPNLEIANERRAGYLYGFLAGLQEKSSVETNGFQCKANRTADPPQDCDWPHCGCDPAADRVLAALQEEGFTLLPPSRNAPERARPEKAPNKSGVEYMRELVTYCGLTQQAIFGIPFSRQLEFLLEQLANAQDDALALHHAYVDLKYPQTARSPLEPARELSPSEAASFDKTLARSPRVKSPGVRIETITHEDGSKTEMHMLGDLLKEPEKSSGEQLYRLRPLCICDNALTNQNPACPIHGSSEKASEPPKLNKYTGFDRPGADCEHCKRQLRDHGPNYECPPLNGDEKHG